MKKRCEHLMVDSWHVPTQEARELIRLPRERRYGWRDQLRAEMSGAVSRWMWPGLAGLLAVGVLIRDWWLVIGASAGTLFFLYQAMTLVRALGSGDVVITTSRELTEGPVDGQHPTCRAVTDVDGQRREVDVDCQQCIDALRAKTTLELAVLIDPASPGNNWLVGFREK